MSASVFAPSGTPDHASGGEMFGPSHVYSAGITPPSSKAVLVSLRVIFSTPLVSFSTIVVGAGATFEFAGVVVPRRHAASNSVHESNAVKNLFRAPLRFSVGICTDVIGICMRAISNCTHAISNCTPAISNCTHAINVCARVIELLARANRVFTRRGESFRVLSVRVFVRVLSPTAQRRVCAQSVSCRRGVCRT